MHRKPHASSLRSLLSPCGNFGCAVGLWLRHHVTLHQDLGTESEPVCAEAVEGCCIHGGRSVHPTRVGVVQKNGGGREGLGGCGCDACKPLTQVQWVLPYTQGREGISPRCKPGCAAVNADALQAGGTPPEAQGPSATTSAPWHSATQRLMKVRPSAHTGVGVSAKLLQSQPADQHHAGLVIAKSAIAAPVEEPTACTVSCAEQVALFGWHTSSSNKAAST